MFTFLLVVQAIVATALVAVILMQRSEGGGLGTGGSPSGFMSARGAADFLTRSTAILATVFVTLSVVMAVMASVQHAPSNIDTSLVKTAPAPAAGAVPAAPTADPLAGAAQAVGNGAAAGNSSVPLAN
ncbi:preprotein translocase subunit SecG [Sphingobium aquiterrae]|uniref:preprotein translocase subunit SecG n=1 Tax=Sphingobium aquiterrae TaxID=2038656 RepID=UPI00301B4C1F